MQYVAAAPGWFVVARFPDGRMERAPVGAWLARETRLVAMVKGGPAVLAPADEVYSNATLELFGPSGGTTSTIPDPG